MFGEGVHPGAGALFERKLAPFLTQTSLAFWRSRLWYFQQGLYYQGGMVRPRRRPPRPARAAGSPGPPAPAHRPAVCQSTLRQALVSVPPTGAAVRRLPDLGAGRRGRRGA
jgi:hypothetical protein